MVLHKYLNDLNENERKKIEFGGLKNAIFSSPPILNIFLPKFQGSGLIKKIDAKGMDVAEPIWLSDCPKCQLISKGLFGVIVCFLVQTMTPKSPFEIN